VQVDRVGVRGRVVDLPDLDVAQARPLRDRVSICPTKPLKSTTRSARSPGAMVSRSSGTGARSSPLSVPICVRVGPLPTAVVSRRPIQRR
jgi:hypothetical protein